MVISIASQKGGTGKSSTSISLAAGLAHLGKKTLLIDIDSQANSSKVLLHNYQSLKPDDTIYRTIMERGSLPVHPTLVANLSVVPSHILLADTDIRLTTAIDHREARLKTELEQVKADYDFVFIDCPPTLSWGTINALTAADKVIVTVAPGYFELDSIVQISKTIEQVHEYFNPQIDLLGFLFTMSDPTITTQTSLKILRQTYTQRVLQTIIPRNTDLRDAHFNRQDIFSYNKEAKAARAYRMLIAELFHL
jgi:chromosome partitioning protein